MKIFADYHTHTVYSHGKGTIEENVKRAVEIGLKEIAISDHGPNHFGFGVKKENFKIMREEVNRLNEKYRDIKVLLGVEANIVSYDGDIDVDDKLMKHLDILLVGFHFGAMPKTFRDAYRIYLLNYIGKISSYAAQKARELNTIALTKAINKYNINLITHPGAKVDIDTRELAKAASKAGTALEINSSHGHLTVEYIKVAAKENVKFIISSDAHRPEDVGRVEQGIFRAEQAGLDIAQISNATH